MTEILTHCQNRGLVSFLAVFKRHRKTNSYLPTQCKWLFHGDGFSSNKKQQRKTLEDVCRTRRNRFKNKGRFYFAKDSTLRPETAERYLTKDAINKFKALKTKFDPNSILQSDLYKRVFGDKVLCHASTIAQHRAHRHRGLDGSCHSRNLSGVLETPIKISGDIGNALSAS